MNTLAGAGAFRLDFDRPAVRHGMALAVAAAALLLRLWHIDAEPLWFDEAMTVHIVHEPDGLDFVHNTPPLYYWLLRVWVDWFGVGSGALRALSAVAGAAFVWACFHTARLVFGNRAALPAALFALLSPIHLYYSQEARAYSLLLLELMLALWAMWRLAAAVRLGRWLCVVAASAVAVYTHYLAAIPLGIACAVVGASAPAGERWRCARALFAAAITVAVLLLPWVLWWSERTPFEARDMQWLAILWQRLSTFDAFASSAELLLIGGQEGHTPIFLKQFTSLSFPDLLRVAGFAATAVLLVVFALQLRRERASRRVATCQCAVLFVGPLVALYVASFVQPVYCPGRYDLIALPGLVLLLGGAIGAGLGAAGTATKATTAACALVLGFVLAAKDIGYFSAAPAPDPERAVAQHLAAHVAPDETVVLCGIVGVPVLAHLYQDGFTWVDHRCESSRGHAGFGCRVLPASLESAPATASRYLRALEDGSLVTELATLVAELAAPGIWLVIGEDLRQPGGPNEVVARRLFAVLTDGGYRMVPDDLLVGVAHFVRSSAR